MIARYLLDASAFWRFRREPAVYGPWQQEIIEGTMSLCEATQVEILRSARHEVERRQMRKLLDSAFRPAPVPKDAWAWIESAQERLTARGQQRAAGVVDLLVAATAVDRDLTVLHDDKDFEAIARVLPELSQSRIARSI